MRARAIALALALVGLLAVWACLWGVVPLAMRAVAGWSPAAAEAGFTAILYGAILLAAVVLGRIGGVPRAWPDAAAWRGFAGGGGIGVGGLTLAIGYCALAGTLGRGQGGAIGALWLLGLVVVALQVLAEEAMFRGVVQPLLARGIGGTAAVAVTALAFAALHGVAGGIDAAAFANMLLGGLLFGVLALRGGGIAPALGAHLAWNGGEQLVVGLDPNPGVGAFGSLLDLDLTGRAAWGGSDMGLNGSFAMAFALAAVLVLALRQRRA